MYKIIFMGTPEFAVPSLKVLIENASFDIKLVITQPDKSVGRHKKLQFSPIKKLAMQNNIEVIAPIVLKKNIELINKIKSIAPDVIVVVAYGKILPKDILDIPKMGVVNIHASILPKYRGASPVTESILAGDKQTGVTLMKLDTKMDTGPILATSKIIPINNKDTADTLSQKLAQIGAGLLIDNLEKYIDNNLKLQPQDDTKATYTKLINKSDGQIDWHETAKIIEKKVRAYSPWPSTFTTFKDKSLKILEAETIIETKNLPGQVWKTEDKYPAITTSQGSLKLNKLQLESKKPVSGKDFLLGYPNFIDSVLN